MEELKEADTSTLTTRMKHKKGAPNGKQEA
jgi:hypothetical protein